MRSAVRALSYVALALWMAGMRAIRVSDMRVDYRLRVHMCVTLCMVKFTYAPRIRPCLQVPGAHMAAELERCSGGEEFYCHSTRPLYVGDELPRRDHSDRPSTAEPPT